MYFVGHFCWEITSGAFRNSAVLRFLRQRRSRTVAFHRSGCKLADLRRLADRNIVWRFMDELEHSVDSASPSS